MDAGVKKGHEPCPFCFVLLGSGFAFEPVFPFAVFPHDEDGGGVEDGRVGSAENTHEQDDHEVADAVTAEERQREQREHDGQLGIDRTIQRLHDGVVDE